MSTCTRLHNKILECYCTLSTCTRLHSKITGSDEAYQLHAHGRWFSPGTPASSTTKICRHDIDKILLKVALNTKIQIKSNHSKIIECYCTLSSCSWLPCSLLEFYCTLSTCTWLHSKIKECYCTLSDCTTLLSKILDCYFTL